MFPELTDLMEDVPAHFPRFFFAGHQTDAQWLSRYLWYHFKSRGGAGKCLFNQEYVTTWDMWMGGAIHPRLSGSIQDVHRHMLRLDIKADDKAIVVGVKDQPSAPLQIVLEGRWQHVGTGETGSEFAVNAPGVHRFER